MASNKPTDEKSVPHFTGHELFNQVVKLTGIPSQKLKAELRTILDKKNIDLNDLTIDQLRSAVATYLREIMSGVLDRKQQIKE